MKRFLTASVLAFAASYGISAQAQEAGQPSYFQKPMPAPSKAFEINVGTAYNQGWGNLTDPVSAAGQTFGRQLQDVAGAGLQFELDLGYRASPAFAAGIYGTVAQFTNQTQVEGTNVRSVTAGIQGQWYARPFRSLNPWLTLGTGYRGNWVVPEVGGNIGRHGWQIARLQAGADFRLSRDVAIAPYVAGDINIIISENLPNGLSRNLDGPPAFASITAGVLGRFDLGGMYVTPGGAVARRQ